MCQYSILVTYRIILLYCLYMYVYKVNDVNGSVTLHLKEVENYIIVVLKHWLLSLWLNHASKCVYFVLQANQQMPCCILLAWRLQCSVNS